MDSNSIKKTTWCKCQRNLDTASWNLSRLHTARPRKGTLLSCTLWIPAQREQKAPGCFCRALGAHLRALVNLHGLAAGLCAPPRAGSTHCTPRGCWNPRRGLGDGQVSWHPHSLSVSILPAPDSKPGSASVFTSVPNFPICSFIACSCCRERCIQDFLRSGFPFLTLRSNNS